MQGLHLLEGLSEDVPRGTSHWGNVRLGVPRGTPKGTPSGVPRGTSELAARVFPVERQRVRYSLVTQITALRVPRGAWAYWPDHSPASGLQSLGPTTTRWRHRTPCEAMG